MPIRLRRLWIACGLAGYAVALTATAQQADTQEQITPDEVITVVAHRQPRQLSEIAGTVSVITADEIARNMVLNAQDLVRYEMGVELDDASTRFGHSGFRIRGIGGNRTAVVVDQVAIADRFAVGSFSDTGRGLLDLGLANRVEILRGPASTLYGSDALGGVVAIQTLTPEDVLTSPTQGVTLRLGAASDAQRGYGRVATAFQQGDSSVLLAGSARYREEPDAAGLDDAELDPQRVRQSGALLKWQQLSAMGTWQVSFDALRETIETQVQHSLGSGRQANTTALRGDDERFEWRAIVSLTTESKAWADRGQWRAYVQQAETHQHSYEERANLAEPLSIFRGFRYDYDSYGVAADLEMDLHWGGIPQRLGYGFELSRAEVWDERDAWQWNYAQQRLTKNLLGEIFPLRDFPRSRIDEAGIYLHDEIKLNQAGLTLSPGLRYESYDLEVRSDPLFEERYPQSEVADLSHDAWLPKLGLLWPWSEQAEWFAQYARGYRAPPFADVNVGLYYPQFRVLAIANPDLEPERGVTFETGLRWHGQDTRVQVTAFHNRYSDFIESRASLGFDPQRQLLIFQSVNRDKVVIEGLELSWQQQWDRRWSSEIWLQASRGEDETNGRDLATVQPPSMLAELRYSALNGVWDTRVLLRAQRDQKELVDNDGEPLFSAPGYATLDWLWQWYPRANLQVGVGLFNLTDRRYWHASQVGNYPQDDPVIPLLAQPGRHIRATLDIHF
ncbi:TonB-dependent receptor domain-containing protein [Pseudidiomarina insulisalsae]|uniref:TonB-dependent receptor n=1 Tax=Pseudidiomarina insulisalsae TaxID=575789 RepID=A0A432YQ89_9GAMM|nr:TonB-dependent receptor [Pseudidiomarina insulisalsae]RUO63508.1 TonB-dependent receptor [Pseudidiomarina insulisalsae]